MPSATSTRAVWLQFTEGVAKYYHWTEGCEAQIRDMNELVEGTAQEAKSRGIDRCPDCEKHKW